MEYASADPSVVKSIRQRVLLNAWLRALRRPNALPSLADFDPDAGSDELADMMGFDVEGDRALDSCLRMIFSEKPLHTFPDHARAYAFTSLA